MVQFHLLLPLSECLFDLFTASTILRLNVRGPPMAMRDQGGEFHHALTLVRR